MPQYLGMIEGIYAINFRSTRDHGDGIIVATAGKINGGDKFCVYRGSYKEEGTEVEADVHVTLHSQGGVTIFGTGVKDFHLRLKGAATETSLQCSGEVVEQPGLKMSLQGRKLAGVA